jgi:carbamoyltransferase
LDAFGDRRSGGIWRLHDGRLHLLAELPAPQGPALLFGAVAERLGYAPGDEGKVVALAASGDPSIYAAELGSFLSAGDLPGSARPLRDVRSLPLSRPADLAAALQATVERAVGESAVKALQRWGGDGLALAGGLFANVALNRELIHWTGRPAFVFPAMGDAGLCVGAAFAALAARGGEPQAIADVRLGPGAPSVPASIPDLAGHLAAGGLVAACRGRMEFGPRALGARSLLFGADAPSRPVAVNRALGRDPVMPFGPVITAESARRFLRGYGPELAPLTRFMTVAWPATDELRRVAPVAVHADGTARAQVLEQQDDPELHALLSTLPEPVLINTSLNRHGEPIACTRPQAASVAAAVGARLWG